MIIADLIATTAAMMTQAALPATARVMTQNPVVNIATALTIVSRDATLLPLISILKAQEAVQSLEGAQFLEISQEAVDTLEVEAALIAMIGMGTLNLRTEINLNTRPLTLINKRFTSEPTTYSSPSQYASSLYAVVSPPTSQEKGSHFLKARLHFSSSSWTSLRGNYE